MSNQKDHPCQGQRVVLQGLSTTELNGHRGVVVRWRQDPVGSMGEPRAFHALKFTYL